MKLPVRIAGLGWYLPARRVTSAELEAQLNIPSGWVERTTGVRERRYATAETSVSMGVAAARMALARAGLAPADLDAMIGASSAPQQAIPSHRRWRRLRACVSRVVDRARGRAL